MQALHDRTVRVNSGHAWEMKKGQRVRITFQSIVDFVVFNLNNLQERFDQARTKANQGKIYLSTGDQLLAKTNTPMMTIVEDTFKGTHDLQYGMCSECSYTSRWNRRHLPPWNKLYPEAGITCREDLPLWGCYENIMTALQNYPIIPLDRTVANLNMDMIGRDEDSATWSTTADQNRNGVNIVGSLYSPDLRRIIERSNAKIGLNLDFKTDGNDPESWFARSDHFWFATKSVPMVLFTRRPCESLATTRR